MTRTTRWALAIFVVVLAAIGADRLRADATSRISRVWDSHEVFALPPPEYVRRATLGYDDAAAAVLWASVLYQYGEHVGKNKRFPFAVQYLQTITHLVPTFRQAYRFAPTLVTMQASAPTRAELDATRVMLRTGTEMLPDDADVWGAYATFMMFDAPMYLAQPEKLAWRVDGARAAQRAVELGFALDTLGVVGAKFLDQAGLRSVAIAQLRRAYAVAPNDEVRSQIALRLRRMESADALDRFRREQQHFIDRWRAEGPFVDETLFRMLEQGRPGT